MSDETPFRPVIVQQDGVTIGHAEGLTFVPETDFVTEPAIGPGQVSGSFSLELVDTRLFEKARRSAVAEMTIDMTPQLRQMLADPLLFAERVLLGRPLQPWERQKMLALFGGCRDPRLQPADPLDELKALAAGIRRALGIGKPSHRRRERKRAHLELLRHLRQHPDKFAGLRYLHRWIPTRCGECRALFATETFISFVMPNGRRTYIVEREDLLDCGHPSFHSYPVEWERDGLPIANQSTRD